MNKQAWMGGALWLAMAVQAAQAGSGVAWRSAGLHITAQQAVQDAQGRVLVPAGRYDSVFPAGQVAQVSRQGLHGLIDAQGRELTPVRHAFMQWLDQVRDGDWFLIGQASSSRRQPWYGLLDGRGRTVIEPAWDGIYPRSVANQADGTSGRSNSLAYLEVERDGLLGSFRPDGQVALPAVYQRLQALGDDSTLVLARQGALWGLCDALSGQCPIALAAGLLKPMQHGPAEGQLLMAQRGGLWGVLDRQGRVVLPLVHDTLQEVADSPRGDTRVLARQGFERQQLRMLPDGKGGWLAQAVPGALPGGHDHDQHPEAARQPFLVDARYLPVGLQNPVQWQSALAAGRLRQAVPPSIQLSDRRALVQLAALQGPGQPALPAVLVNCPEPGGFRLLNVPAEGRQAQRQACADEPAGGLRFEGDRTGLLTCHGCAPLGLPTQWVRQDHPAALSCPTDTSQWDLARAKQDMAAWAPQFATHWRPLVQGKDPLDQHTWSDLVDLRSRAMNTLVGLRQGQDQVDLAHDLGAAPPRELANRVIDALAQAQPVRFGGAYPETIGALAGACTEVWYVRLPAVEARLASPRAGQPLIEPYALPPAGRLQRNVYPFLVWRRDAAGLHLTGISKEFMQAVWWLHGGR